MTLKTRLAAISVMGGLFLAGGAHAETGKGEVVELTATEAGFQPADVMVKKDVPLTIVVTRKTDATCAKEIVIEDYGVRATLPLNKPVTLKITPRKTGEIRYACGMGMVTGVLMVE